MTTVHLPSILRDLAQGEDKVEVSPGDLGAVLAELESRYPGLAARIRDEKGSLRPHVKIFINGEDVGLEASVKEGDEIRILPSISGG